MNWLKRIFRRRPLIPDGGGYTSLTNSDIDESWRRAQAKMSEAFNMSSPEWTWIKTHDVDTGEPE